MKKQVRILVGLLVAIAGMGLLYVVFLSPIPTLQMFSEQAVVSGLGVALGRKMLAAAKIAV